MVAKEAQVEDVEKEEVVEELGGLEATEVAVEEKAEWADLAGWEVAQAVLAAKVVEEARAMASEAAAAGVVGREGVAVTEAAELHLLEGA